jgi:hypothetical protein
MPKNMYAMSIIHHAFKLVYHPFKAVCTISFILFIVYSNLNKKRTYEKVPLFKNTD